MLRSRAIFQIATSGAGGSFTLPIRDIHIPENRYYITSAKGSGPGGMAVNSSRNKANVYLTGCVESATLPGIPQDVWENFLLENYQHITKHNEMCFTSHHHRSLHENINECLRKIQRYLHEASFKPAPKEPIVIDTRHREKRKFKAKLRGSKEHRRIMRSL